MVLPKVIFDYMILIPGYYVLCISNREFNVCVFNNFDLYVLIVKKNY